MSRERVSGDDLDYNLDTLVYRDGVRFSGVAEDRYPDGAVQFETEYRNGILDGTSRTYWPDGEVRRETWYEYGIKLRERSWYESGRPQEDLVLDESGVKHHYRWAEDGANTQAFYRRAKS